MWNIDNQQKSRHPNLKSKWLNQGNDNCGGHPTTDQELLQINAQIPPSMGGALALETYNYKQTCAKESSGPRIHPNKVQDIHPPVDPANKQATNNQVHV